MTDKLTPLLPCPGCGFNVIIPFDDLDDNHPTVSWGVLCGNPDCEWQISCAFISKEHAIAAWNTRQALSSPAPRNRAGCAGTIWITALMTRFNLTIMRGCK